MDGEESDFELSQRPAFEEDYQADDEIDVGEQAKVYDEEEEDPTNSQILPSETADIDFNLNQELPTITEDIEDTSSSETEQVEEDKLEVKLETSVNKKSSLASKEADKLVKEIEGKRARKPSSKIVEIEETKQQIEYEKANPIPITKKPKPKPKFVDGYASDFHQSVATAASEIIQKDIRLESYSATSQAKKIYGSDFTILTAPTAECALCGCMFKDRISYSHNRIFYPNNLERLTITYDHFAPVNFSALVFRIPVAAGVYTPEEMNLFKLNGHMTCYHCNYVKSQRMFITCPKKGGVVDFNNFQPNVPNIKKFFNDLVNSENVHGLAKDGSKTLDKCLKIGKTQWIEQRIEVIKNKAQELCTQIKTSVNLGNVKKRIQMTKIIIRKALRELSEEDKFIALSPKYQYRYKREYISRLFGELELTFTKPWNQQDVIISPDLNKPYTPVRILNPFEKEQLSNRSSTPAPRPDPRGEPGRSTSRQRRRGGSRRKLKNKRKTYRGIRLF
jgi:hypothetical protein